MKMIGSDAGGANAPSVLISMAELQALREAGGNGQAMPQDDALFDPRKLIDYAIRYRWLIVAFVLFGLLAGLVKTYSQTPMYRATARLEIQAAAPRIYEELQVSSQADQYYALENAIVKFQSGEVARRIVKDLKLAEEDAFLASKPKFSLLNLITGSQAEDPLAGWSLADRENAAAGIVLGGLSVSAIRDTSIVTVSFTHVLPQYTALVANQAMRSFIDYTIDQSSQSSDLARQFLKERVIDAKEKLQLSEKALVNYAKAHNITVTGDDGSLIAENIGQMNGALAQAIQERLASERDLEQVDAGKVGSLPAVYESVAIQNTRHKIAELKADYEEKRGTLKPEFPVMRRIQAEIRELQRQIDEEIASIAAGVATRVEQARQKEAGIRRALADLETRQRDFQDKTIQYTILKREVDSSRSQYDQLIGQLGQVGIGSELKNANATIVDLAVTPGSPSGPALKRNLLLALALSLAVCAGLIYLFELIHNKFNSAEEVEAELDLPVLGVIAESEGDMLDALSNPRSQLSENYHSLRTSLQFAGLEQEVKTLLVTSSEPSEGKSSTVYKLALDFAALGRRVLVIDADLRRPSLHRLFQAPAGPGLSNLLSNVFGEGEVLSMFHRTRVSGVTLLAAGTIAPNPAHLLSSPKLGEILRACSRFFDIILIDSPPILNLADAQILARQADGTMLVVSSTGVTRKAAKAAIARLRAAKSNLVGAAFTRIAPERLGYSYSASYVRYEADGIAPAQSIFHYAPWLERDLQRIRLGLSGAAQHFAPQGREVSAQDTIKKDAA